VGQWISWPLHQFPSSSPPSCSLTHEPGRSLISWPRIPASFVDYLNYQSQVIGGCKRPQQSIVHLCMKFSLGMSNFLEKISSLSHSVVFIYFFALIAEEGFLISPCYSWNSAFQWVYLSFSPLLFTSLLFTAFCKASSDSNFAFLYFFFLGMVFIPVSCTMSWTSIYSSSGTLSIRSSPLNLFLTSTV